jgi:hypothetical protein
MVKKNSSSFLGMAYCFFMISMGFIYASPCHSLDIVPEMEELGAESVPFPAGVYRLHLRVSCEGSVTDLNLADYFAGQKIMEPLQSGATFSRLRRDWGPFNSSTMTQTYDHGFPCAYRQEKSLDQFLIGTEPVVTENFKSGTTRSTTIKLRASDTKFQFYVTRDANDSDTSSKGQYLTWVGAILSRVDVDLLLSSPNPCISVSQTRDMLRSVPRIVSYKWVVDNVTRRYKRETIYDEPLQ